MRRQIETGNMEAWVIRLYLAKKSPGSAGDVEQPRPHRPLTEFPARARFKRDERLAPHRCRAAAEQHLDLMVVALGGSIAQIPISLKMEFLQIIRRVSTRRRVCQDALLASAMPPLLDRAQIGEEVERAADLLQRIAEPVSWGRVVAGLDVAPILLHQRAQVREETLPVRHWPPAKRFRQSHWTTHSGGQQLLAEKPADARGLRRVERHPVQWGYHSERGVNAEARLCKRDRASDVAPHRGAGIIDSRTER